MVAVVVNLAVHAGKSRQRQTVCDRAGGLKNFGKSAVCFLVPFRAEDRRFVPADGIYDVNNQTRRSSIICDSAPRQKSSGRARVRARQSPTPAMPLIYAFVARGTTVLAEHTSHSGNFATVAAEVRALLPPFCDVVAFFCVPPARGSRAAGTPARLDRDSIRDRRL